MINKITDVIIVGAGPSGLIMGHYLAKANVSFLILEKSIEVGNSWGTMPEHLSLITHWKSNCLLDKDSRLFPDSAILSAKEFQKYLISFSQGIKSNIILSEKVVSISKPLNIFEVETENNMYIAKMVIDCRGYYSFPNMLKFEMSGETNPEIIHFKDYTNSQKYEIYKKILIIGKGLSAGQLIEDLSRNNPNRKLLLSIRSPLKYTMPSILFNVFLKYLDTIEWLIFKCKKNLKNEVKVPMAYSAKRIIDNNVKIVSTIKRIEGKVVYFVSGEIEIIDLIILATGFKPDQIHLKNDFESSEVDDLFYLGRDTQVSFTSRFLRGIRTDAPILSKLIVGRLFSRNNSQ